MSSLSEVRLLTRGLLHAVLAERCDDLDRDQTFKLIYRYCRG
jgi:hypothetical protein